MRKPPKDMSIEEIKAEMDELEHATLGSAINNGEQAQTNAKADRYWELEAELDRRR